MMADGMQSSAKRQIRLLVPQSTGGPPIATSTRLCEIAGAIFRLSTREAEKGWPSGLATFVLDRNRRTKRPAKGSLPLVGRDTSGGSGGAQRNESPVSFS
ncbi:hypothetical protein QTO30_20680 [Yoonia sp. GPGPB17]|uniref:hypothetical protein n=1 Tax=Yoonia sp. GPGPB17 TaxID=3026147 RepID=UPI0030BE9547